MRPGVTVEAVAGVEGPRAVLQRPRAGKSLRTTIDLKLQGSADKILADVKPASAIVAIRAVVRQDRGAGERPGRQGCRHGSERVTTRPGSTFKLVTALAFLRSGPQAVEHRAVHAAPSRSTGARSRTTRTIPSSAIGKIPLSSAIANSCNTAMIATRGKAPQDKLAEAAAALGLGPDLDLGFPAYLGSVPTEAKGTEHAASMIGQGKIEASPLAMAVVAASIATRLERHADAARRLADQGRRRGRPTR